MSESIKATATMYGTSDSFGRELNRISNDARAVVLTMTGEMASDQDDLNDAYDELEKEYERYQEAYEKEYRRQEEDIQSQYDEFNSQYDLDIRRLTHFPEMFIQALQRRADSVIAKLEELEIEIDDTLDDRYLAKKQKVAEMQAEFDELYGFVIDLTKGSFLEKIVGSLLMIGGGLMNDANKIFHGDGTSKEWGNIIGTIIAVVVIVVILWFTGGTTAGIVAAVLVGLSQLLTLDATYANGTLLGAIFSLLDFVFNDLLNLDDTIGSDFKHFDKNDPGYADMQATFKIVVAIAATIAKLVATWGMGSMFEGFIPEALETAVSVLGAAYTAYAIAMSIGDLLAAREAYNDLLNELNRMYEVATTETIEAQKVMTNHAFTDAAYIQTDTDEIINGYVLSFDENPIAPFDPSSTIPMNTRYAYDDEGMQFGFESLFDMSQYGGDRDYAKNIIIRSKFGVA